MDELKVIRGMSISMKQIKEDQFKSTDYIFTPMNFCNSEKMKSEWNQQLIQNSPVSLKHKKSSIFSKNSSSKKSFNIQLDEIQSLDKANIQQQENFSEKYSQYLIKNKNKSLTMLITNIYPENTLNNHNKNSSYYMGMSLHKQIENNNNNNNNNHYRNSSINFNNQEKSYINTKPFFQNFKLNPQCKRKSFQAFNITTKLFPQTTQNQPIMLKAQAQAVIKPSRFIFSKYLPSPIAASLLKEKLPNRDSFASNNLIQIPVFDEKLFKLNHLKKEKEALEKSENSNAKQIGLINLNFDFQQDEILEDYQPVPIYMKILKNELNLSNSDKSSNEGKKKSSFSYDLSSSSPKSPSKISGYLYQFGNSPQANGYFGSPKNNRRMTNNFRLKAFNLLNQEAFSKDQQNDNGKKFIQVMAGQQKQYLNMQIQEEVVHTRDNQKINILQKVVKFLRRINNFKLGLKDIIGCQVFSTKPFQQQGSYELIESVKMNEIANVQYLLEINQILVYDFDYINMSPLHWACKRGHYEIARMLIFKGADVDAKDIIGRTPLFFAISNNDSQIVKLLLLNSAQPWSNNMLNLKQLLAKANSQCNIAIQTARQIHLMIKFLQGNVLRQQIFKEKAVTNGLGVYSDIF